VHVAAGIRDHLGVSVGGVDFFVSYTSADRPWAEWIAWELEHAGYSVIVQAWDILPGSNFVLAMHEAARRATRTIAVLSPAFLESRYCSAEWAAAFREDPAGEQRKLVPVRVRDCKPDGLLGSVVYIDVVGLSEASSRTVLLAGITDVRAKPATAPAFPAIAEGGKRERVPRPEAGAAIFNVPVMTRTFVGRHEQLRLLGKGLAGGGAIAITQVHAIHGMGGVGKTQLAARYAREHRDDYDVIWWLRAERPETLRTDLAGLAVALGLVDAEVDEHDAITAAREWLEVNGRWLVVFDNATGPDAIVDVLPEGRGGHVLITSRGHADWRALHARPLALDVWQREESRAFLGERTGEHDLGVLEAVAEALGDLPLALEQAAAYTNTKAITLSGYAERLHRRSADLLGEGRPAGYQHTVSTVWRLAFEQIAEHPIAYGLLAVCAHLAPERIPRELLEAVVEHSKRGDVGAQAADDAIELLLAYALLTTAAEQTFDMHRLIGQLTRDRLDVAAQAGAAAAAVTAVHALWPTRPWEHEHWSICQRLFAHALTATEHSQRHDAAPEHTASVMRRAGQYEQARAQLTSARRLIERALAIDKTVYGPEHPEVARALNALSAVQRDLGDLEAARTTLQQALAIEETLYGAEHPRIAHSLSNLGLLHLDLGELEVARGILQHAVAVAKAVYGPEHPKIAMTLANLGLVHCNLGELEEARDIQRWVLAIDKAVDKPAHPEVACALNSLGVVRRELGDLEAARATLQQALAVEEALYGSEHPEIARTLGVLGVVRRDLKEPEAARATLQQALAIFEAVYGSEHPEVAITLTNLGLVQRDLGDLEAARTTLQQALRIFEHLLGPDHADTHQARRDLQSIGSSSSDGPISRRSTLPRWRAR
jgi:tetratricopeptide (TPR) repeat protein